MSEYVIVSDATLDLPVSTINEYGIKIIPMGINVDDEEYSHIRMKERLQLKSFIIS